MAVVIWDHPDSQIWPFWAHESFYLKVHQGRPTAVRCRGSVDFNRRGGYHFHVWTPGLTTKKLELDLPIAIAHPHFPGNSLLYDHPPLVFSVDGSK